MDIHGSETPACGIWLFRASRLEALLDPLLVLLDSHPPAGMLAPQTVIVAHPGMRQWLLGEIARRRGPGGIVANLDAVLPGAWLDRLADRLLDERTSVSRPFRRELLRWRVHDVLAGIEDARLRAYLGGSDAARRRFQLADRLARIFTQYLVYRPDWLRMWAMGREAFAGEGFLAPLWRRLRAAIAEEHRGEMLERLITAIASAPAFPDADEPLHVFGVTHLAPSELAALHAVARRRLVVFHVPDPCGGEFWAGMAGERERLRALAELQPDAPETEAAFLELHHPLLANWGRIGQHFLLQLEEGGVAIDERHHLDRAEAAIVPGDRLACLQESIRRAEPALARSGLDAAAARADRSLRVHACHTRLRELEVLRDALLRELSERPGLAPADIVVMAPDIQAYAPLLPAVFGEAGRHGGVLPYHLADVAIARTHPLFDAFARLLALPQSRLTAPEVVDLLAVPQVAERFGLSVQDVDTVAGWLREGRVAWALDGDFRARFGVPAIDAQTFGWGMDRMLAGYAIGCDDADAVVELADGSQIAPLPGIEGTRAERVGALDALLVELAHWCAAGERVLTAKGWAAWLETRFDAIARIDPLDADARDARQAVLAAIRAIAAEPAECGLDPTLEFGIVRDLLLGALAEVPERQRFLVGAVTFCGMVPQRAIPFRVVAVLGLDDGAFPRAGNDAGLDPMRTHRRIGDRDVRNDDRWLFLQTVMSARDALHLSHVGEGVRDGKPRNPAAPLADLIALLDPDPSPMPDIGSDDPEDCAKAIARRPWFVRHPLQPFDARYFDGGDPALFSHNRDFAELDARAAMAVAPANRPAPERTAGGDAVGVEPLVAPAAIALDELVAYFRDPAKQLLTRRAKLRLDALDDDRLREREALDAQTEAIDRIAHRAFMDALGRADRVVPDAPPDILRLTGLLPPGGIGDQAWRNEAEKARALLDGVATHPMFAVAMPARIVLPIDHAGPGWRTVGESRRAWAVGETLWIFDAYPGRQEKDLGFKERIGLFLEWALLRLDARHAGRAVRLHAAVGKGDAPWQRSINAWDENHLAVCVRGDEAGLGAHRAQLELRVAALVDHWLLARETPQPYYPKTSWSALAAPEKAHLAWVGAYRSVGERDYAPGYARVLAGAVEFSLEDGSLDGLALLAAQLHDCITLPDPLAGAAP